MTDKTLYFLRHGQAESNANNFYAGQSDVALTPLGVEQAKAAAPLLAHIKFDKIFCSDLRRAKCTAALALPGAVCEYTALIREIDVGTLAYKRLADCETELGEAFLNCRKQGDYAYFGGESREQLNARARAFLDRVAAMENAPAVGAVCHGGFMRAVARVVGDSPALVMPDNCAVCVFSYTNGQWRLKRWNVTVEI